jgi:formylglycine-generating enzyme required for sulfatase activity
VRSAVAVLGLALLLVAAAGAPAQRASALAPGHIKDCPSCPELVTIPAGVFTLGTSGDASEVDRVSGEAPPLQATIGRAYAIGRTEVTVRQFRAFVAATHYAAPAGCRIARDGHWQADAERSWRDPGFGDPPSEDQPVVCVSWDDAQAYLEWLSRVTNHHYRLPSETEWEYAARGGTTTARYWGERDSSEADVPSRACDYANVYDISAVAQYQFLWPNARCSDRHAGLAAVASYQPNAFDLYDMIGNAREWLQDCYTASYEGRPPDARAWVWAGGCEARGVRGGSFASRPERSRAAARDSELQGTRQQDLGFRVARDLD